MSEQLRISLISFNTLGVPVYSKNLPERYLKLADTIKTQHADAQILSFQEVHTYIHLQLLKKALSAYPYVMYKKFLYGPKGGLVIFSKIPMEMKSFIMFEEKGSLRNMTFYARFIRNGTLVCKLLDHPVYILNTYLTTNPDRNWLIRKPFSEIQETQIHDLTNIITTLQTDNNAIVVTGDFNFTKDSSSYKLFTSQIHATDVFEKFSLPTYLYERRALKFLWRIPFMDRLFMMNAKQSGQVDFIFLTNHSIGTSTKEAKYIFGEKVKLLNGKNSYLSDHIGLYAKLEFSI